MMGLVSRQRRDTRVRELYYIIAIDEMLCDGGELTIAIFTTKKIHDDRKVSDDTVLYVTMAIDATT